MTAVHVLIPSYNCAEWIDRCLDSVAAQTRPADKVLVIDDASTQEGYAQHVKTRCDAAGWSFWRNTHNRKCPDNLCHGIGRLEPGPEDVIFLLDGDDFLPPHALERIEEVYEDPEVWLTYGNYEPRPYDTGQHPAEAYPESVIADRGFRHHPPIFNHPLTFRHKLWAQVPVEDLKDDVGEFFRGGYDFAVMVPMLEMSAPRHFAFLDETLYWYNAVNPISDVAENLEAVLAAHRTIVGRPKKAQLPWSSVGVIDHEDRRPYGTDETYNMGATWLRDCETVEDWGCGRGWFAIFLPAGRYRGLDIGVDSVPGHNPFASELVDLRTYRSSVPGIFMRHVLEHNHDWRSILRNAVASFTERMLLAIFTPWSTTGATEVVMVNDAGVYDEPNPTLAFDLDELLEVIGPDVRMKIEDIESGTAYGLEHVLMLERLR